MTPQDEIRRAGDARHILENDLFTAAKADLYEKIRQARKAAPINDSLLLTKLIMMEQLADQFFDYFQLVLQTGKVAEAHLAEESQQQSLKDRGLALFRQLGRGAF